MTSKLQVLDIVWLRHIQEARQISEQTLRSIGVPERYVDMDARTDRDNPFTNIVLLSDKQAKGKAKALLTDYIVAGLDTCQPGTSFCAITYADMVSCLTAYKTEREPKKLRQKLYACNALYVYDFGIYPLREWESKEVCALFMSRWNSLQHIALAAEDITPNIVSKHVGTATWGILKRYCICREVV
jgi:hypothetical protein